MPLDDFWYSSTLGSFECLKAAEFYITKADTGEPPNANLQRGTAMHKAAEEYILGVGNGKELPRSLLQYINGLQTTQKRTEVELRFQENAEFRTKGILDLITDDGKIVDWKFPKKLWGERHEYKSGPYIAGQGVLYPYLAQKNNVDVTEMEFVVCDGTNIQVVPVPIDWDQVNQNMQAHRARYRTLANAAANDNFTPSPSTWNCRYCNYRKICPAAI